MFGLLKSHRLIYQDRCDVGGGITSFAFRPEKPVAARAGQHGLLHLGPTTVRPFSPASGSVVKLRLAALRPGAPVAMRGPIDDFTPDGLTGRPFHALPRRERGPRVPYRHRTLGHAYRADTERWATRAAYPEHSDEFRAGVVSAVEASRAHPNSVFYIAGASAFVSSTAALLRDCGVAAGSVRQDKYLGYKPGAAREVGQLALR